MNIFNCRDCIALASTFAVAEPNGALLVVGAQDRRTSRLIAKRLSSHSNIVAVGVHVGRSLHPRLRMDTSDALLGLFCHLPAQCCTSEVVQTLIEGRMAA